MNYQKFEVYTFKVLGIILDSRSDRWFMQIEDEDHQTFKVKPYQWHIEWAGTIDTVNCVCTGTDLAGRHKFVIRKYDILEKFYSVGESYTFTVNTEKATDPNSGQTYYEIVDKSQDISQRYYTNDDLKEGDSLTLTVASITESARKDAFLKFQTVNSDAGTPLVKKGFIDKDTEEELIEARKKVGSFEGQHVEWKSSIAYLAGEIEPNIDKQLGVIMRVIASFQNAEGGTLYIGVNDNGQVCGINQDFQHLNTGHDVTDLNYKYSSTLDSYQLKIHNNVILKLGKTANSNINVKFAKEGDLYYCIVEVKASKRPIYFDGNKLFQRVGNMTQMLTHEDMTNFILDRSSHFTIVPDEVPETVETNIIEPEQESAPIVQPATVTRHSVNDIKFYLRFYADGQWSYSKKSSTEDDLLKEFPIYKDTLKESLLLCYANGCITRISPYEFLNPKRSDNKRKYKKENVRYSNGYNQDSDLLAVYSCFDRDYIAIRSADTEGIRYAKVHEIEAFTKYEAIQSKGKQGVPTGSTDISYTLIQSSQFHFVSALFMKRYKTTTEYGFNQKDPQLKATFENLEKLDKQH